MGPTRAPSPDRGRRTPQLQRDFLRSIISRILDAPGCLSCELFQHYDDPAKFAIIEVWDSIAAHQASVSRIPPELLQQAQNFFAGPPQGAYYDPVPTEVA
ncbi:MAG: putative quinol monooxygenase [Gemmatimonadota bacterium]